MHEKDINDHLIWEKIDNTSMEYNSFEKEKLGLVKIKLQEYKREKEKIEKDVIRLEEREKILDEIITELWEMIE